MNRRKTHRLRVLMLLENNRYPQDGRVRQEAETLAQAGHHVSVICPKGESERWHEVVEDVCVYRFPAPRDSKGFAGYVWEYLYSTATMFAVSVWVWIREGFDVVHAHNPPDVLVFIGAFYKLFGKFFLYDHHDLSPEMYEVRFSGGGKRVVHAVLVILEKLCCKLADHVIATNESYKRVEMERARIPEERISIVRNGPELELFREAQPASDFCCGEEKTVLCYVGTIGFQDGLDYLMRALHHLIRDLGRNDFVCLIVGSGNAWQSMRDLATDLGLDAHVRFTGHVPFSDVPRYVAASDICVDPDPSNPFNDRSTDDQNNGIYGHAETDRGLRFARAPAHCGRGCGLRRPEQRNRVCQAYPRSHGRSGPQAADG